MNDKEQEFKDMIATHAKRVSETFGNEINITEDNIDGLSDSKVSKYPPERLRGLIPVKPGEIRNPGGRPKDIKYISEALKDLLAKDPALLKEVVQAMLKEVKLGNIPALKELLDRTEGKVTDKLLELKAEVQITPEMRALYTREMLETREEEELLKEGNNGRQIKGTDKGEG